MESHEIGRTGEDAACELLTRLGYRIVERNRVVAGVEVDVIALDTRESEITLAFCEVKARSSADFGLPSEAVHATQRRRLRRAAGAWLSGHGRRFGRPRCRFDIVEILVLEQEILGRVLKDAF